MRQRAELLDRKARLAEAKRELLEVPGVSEMRDRMASKVKRRAENSPKHAAVSTAAPPDAPVIDSLPRVLSSDDAYGVGPQAVYAEVSHPNTFVCFCQACLKQKLGGRGHGCHCI